MAWSRSQLETIVAQAAARYGIDPDLAYWQIQRESNWNPDICSSAGACGLAQFMPGTARDYGLTDRTDPEASMDAWGRYMRDLLRMFSGDYAKALAGYNWGQGNVQKAVRNYGEAWRNHLPKETTDYLNYILSRAGADGGGSSNPSITNLVIVGGLIALAFVLLSD